MSNGIQYQIIGGSGGVIIDPSGSSSAVHALHEIYSDRLDWHDLLEAFEERAAIAECDGNETRQAAELIAADGGKGVAIHAGQQAFEAMYGSELDLLAQTIGEAYACASGV